MRDYNFFESYQKKRSANINFKSPVFLGLIVIVLIIAASAFSVVQNVVLASRLVLATAELAEVQSSKEYQKAIKLQDSINAMAEYDRNAGVALDRIHQAAVLNTDFLKKLSGVLPSTASIQDVNITTAGGEIYINVPNEKAAAELVGNLENSGLFLQTSLVSVTRDDVSASYVAYINCVLKAGDDK